MTTEADKLRWTRALVAYDFCDPALLASLIESEPVPEELRPVIATIIAGKRKPNRRAAAKSKVPASDRHQIGATIDALLVTIGDMKHPAITSTWADRRQAEPSDAIRRLNDYIDRAYVRAAETLQVKRETVENLVREYRDKARNWPHV